VVWPLEPAAEEIPDPELPEIPELPEADPFPAELLEPLPAEEDAPAPVPLAVVVPG
jgi:hypothetical protein